ncbi:MAG TPA: ATP-binding protein, partial [Aeromonadales bacterium]|nr:ATP-binding protein [Aeromonadales bacterium]
QDLNRIQQVLFNLVGNAIKFTESGEINISCELRSEFLWFHISDTGIGIPSDKIERVFKGFEQVDNSNSKTHEGSGLGLAICLETVTLLGGKINLRSELGKGTIVSFYVPVSPPVDNTNQMPKL